MPESSQRTRSIDDLLRETSDLEARADQIQSARDESLKNALVSDYLRWFGQCLAQLPADLIDRFRGEYEGSAFTSKIRAYLEAPLAPNVLYNPETPDNNRRLGISPWRFPFSTAFRGPLQAQRQLLVEASHRPEAEPTGDVLLVLERILRNIGEFFEVLANRQRGKTGFIVSDEYDVQDALHAILRLHFRDVRPEEWTPSYAGGSTRTDFLLKAERVFVEAKMTRKGLHAVQARAQLAEDIVTYKSHPDCEALFALVYDPAHLIPNSPGFEADLSGSQHGMPVRVVVVS